MSAPKFVRNVEIFRNNVYAIHYFAPDVVKGDEIMVIVPPHAGRHGNVAQRMIDTCVNHGRHTYAYELLSATEETKDTSIQDMLNIIMHIYNVSRKISNNNKIDLIGLCQGAWLSAIFTAKYPELVNRYANFAGPINTQSDGINPDGSKNNIEIFCSTFLNMDYQRWIVNLNNGIQPGTEQWMSFSMAAPAEVYMGRWFDEYWAIFNNDEKELNKLRRNRAWYDAPMNLAGNWFLDCLEHHFLLNLLYKGGWVVGGEVVNLSNITCDVYLYGGEDDMITHPQQVFDMQNVVSSKYVKCTLFPKAGHTKVFVGTSELTQFANDFFGK